MPEHGDRLLIIGGGIIGLCTAMQAQKAGFQVTLLERGGQLAPNCSSANAGMIVPSHFTPLAAPGMMMQGLRWLFNPESPFAIKPSLSMDMARWGWIFCRHSNSRHVAASRKLLCELHMESRQLFIDWAKEFDFGLKTKGLLMLCRDPKVLEEEAKIVEQACRLGLRAEVLDAAGVAKLEPGIDIDVVGALYHAEDAHLDPALLINGLKHRFAEAGGTIHYHCPVARLEHHNGRVRAVHGTGGCFEADQFVIAGGSWTPELVRDLGLRLPLQPGKGYSLTLKAPAQLPAICSLLAEARVAITPMGSSLRVAGTMEIGGLNHEINPRRIQGIIKSVQNYYPAIKQNAFERLEPWVGLRPVSPDGLPYLGPAPGIDNLIIASGHAMMGLSLAPVTGMRVTAMLAGEAPIAQLDPGRFE